MILHLALKKLVYSAANGRHVFSSIGSKDCKSQYAGADSILQRVMCVEREAYVIALRRAVTEY